MTSEKQKNVLGCLDLGKELLFLQSIIALHFKQLIVYYMPYAGNKDYYNFEELGASEITGHFRE